GREIDRPAALQAIVEARPGKIADRLVEIVHAHGDAGGGEVEHFMLDLLAILADPLDRQLALAGHPEISRLILVAEGVAAYDDRVRPAGDDARHVGYDDRLAEDD